MQIRPWCFALALAVSCGSVTPGASPAASPGADAASADETAGATGSDAAAAATTIDGAAGGDIGAGITCTENWAQGYCIKFTFHGQKFDGRTFTLQRDLSGTSSTVVFGDTHMQPPAASLGIHDTWQLGPYKDPLDLNLVLGNLVTAPGFPAFVPQKGDYPFGCKPPYVDLSYGNIRYRSTCPNLSGHIAVTHWTATPGETFSGTFSGHLQQYLTQPGGADDCKASDAALACKLASNSVDIEGTFGLTLPKLNADLAP